LTSVVIPDTVRIIREYAFSECAKLTSVTIPASVIEIGEETFQYCFGLASMAVHPDNPAFASENGALFNKNKTELIFLPSGKTGEFEIPDTVETVKKSAFIDGYVNSLSVIIVPDSLLSEDNIFDCYSYKLVVKISAETKNVKPDFSNFVGFTVHPDNPVYSSIDGVLFNKNGTKLIRYPQLRKGNYVIPDSVKIIDKEAFLNCCYLTSLSIPGSVLEIAEHFRFCSDLTSLIFPSSLAASFYVEYGDLDDFSVSIFGEEAFLLFVDVDDERITIGHSEISIHPDYYCDYTCESGILFNKYMTELIRCPEGWRGDCVIPDTVAEIRLGAFFACTGLTSVTIPDSVTKIGGSAFKGCTGLKEITIPKSVTDIADTAFDSCPAFIATHPENPYYTSENGMLIDNY
jgi:hypothetical protein